MSKSRQAVSMSEEEVADFLAARIKVQVASIGKDGAPHLATLFYVVQDGCIAFWTYGSSQKVKNIERDPRVSALVEDGADYSELAGVSIQGTAEIVRDPGGIRRIGSAVVTAMAGGGPLPDAYYDEFTLQARLPEAPGRLVFKVGQQCEKGRVDWADVAPESKTPAPVLEVLPAAMPMHHH